MGHVGLLLAQGPLHRPSLFARTLLGLALALLVNVLPAGEVPKLGIELNKLAQQGDACVAYLVFGNDLPVRFESLKLELIFFDKAGLIQRHLTLDAAPLAATKTMVKLFQIPNTRCDSLGRVLINDVVQCQGPKGPVEDCLGRLSVSFRGSVELIK